MGKSWTNTLLSSREQIKITFILIFQGLHGGAQERRLLNDLMGSYQKLERPVANESEAVGLKFGLTLQQIMDVVIVFTTFLDMLTCCNICRMRRTRYSPPMSG